MALSSVPAKVKICLPVLPMPLLQPIPTGLIRKEWSGSSPRVFKPPKAPHKSPNPRARAHSPPKLLRSQVEFRFLRNIGAGANSEVACVIRPSDQRMLALKSTKPKDAATMDAVRDSLKYQRMLERHPNILRLLDSWEEILHAQETVHELYELLDGTLTDLLLSTTPRPDFLPESTIWRYIHNIAFGLQYIHSLGLIHGDIKPSNILYNSSQTLQIGDFGSLCHMAAIPEDKAGDSCYEAPECKFPMNDWSQRSDIYSFGLVVFEMIFDVEIPSGEPRYGERNGKTFHQLIRESEDTAIHLGMEVNPSPPSSLLTLVRSMLSVDPSRRPTAECIFRLACQELMSHEHATEDGSELLDDEEEDFLSPPPLSACCRVKYSRPLPQEIENVPRKRSERPIYPPMLSPSDSCLDDDDYSGSPLARRRRSISSPHLARRSLAASLTHPSDSSR